MGWRKLWLLLSAIVLPAWQSDNQLMLTYAPTTKQPNLSTNHSNHGADIGSFRASIIHRDEWEYGSNVLILGFSKDNGHDPKRGSPNLGATQFFGSYRGLLSGNALTDSSIFSNAIVSDLRLSFGMDFNDKNSNLANKKKEGLVGVNVKFNVPVGYLSLGLHYVREWNYNAIVGKSVVYRGHFNAEALWIAPLTFTGLPLKYQLLVEVTTPKGKDGFGRQTVTEVFTQQRLVLDVGDLLWGRPKRLDAFVGLQYWYAKMGGNPHLKSGSVELTSLFGAALHF
jgi:hypothetical protein